jgi:hypothetical protein
MRWMILGGLLAHLLIPIGQRATEVSPTQRADSLMLADRFELQSKRA